MRPATPLLFLSLAVAASASAQVGHAPDNSPYRDIRKGHSVTPLFGEFGGGGGRFGIGAHGGEVYGFRYDVRTAGTVSFGLTLEQGNLKRLIANPLLPVASRISGPVSQNVKFIDATIQLNLTGAKTWHRLAPFTGVSLGVAIGEKTPADTSGFRFGNKFYFAPQLGARYFVSDRISLRADLRGVFWKLSYPASFTVEPAVDPGTATDPHALIPDGRLSEWTLSPWLQVGIGFSFSP